MTPSATQLFTLPFFTPVLEAKSRFRTSDGVVFFFEQKDRLKAYYPQSSNLERFYCNARVELSYGAVAWEHRWPLFRWK